MDRVKRFKRESNSLERLPNELFIEMFGYLNGVDIIYAFSQLNSRIQRLLNVYVKHFDFQSVSKAKFNFILRQQNPEQWRSLHLSNDDRTPGQIELFSHICSFDKYLSQIEFLTISSILPIYTQQCFSQIQSLKNLTSLSIETVCGNNLQSLELPSLKHLTLTGCKHTLWLMNFSNLESLHYTVTYNCIHSQQFVLPTTLQRLKLFYNDLKDGSTVRSLLSQMSQLRTLALYNSEVYSPLKNGQIWEELITSHLPFLKTFQFYFPFINNSIGNPSENLDQIIESYSTPFYLIEKHWFIRCDRNANHYSMGVIYSLPYAFSQMPINMSSFDISLSTLPITNFDETKSKYYKKIETLMFNQECKAPHLGFLATNIHRLILAVKLPLSWHILLSELRHLTLRNQVEISSTEFETILLFSPKLHSLTITSDSLKTLTDKFTNPTVCQYLSERIRSLTISDRFRDRPNLGYVSVRLLISIVRLFALNCEHLSLCVIAQPNTVRPILKRMKNLRSLHLEWRHFSIGIDDPIAAWLDQQTTDKDALDFVYTMDKRHLFIWFGNRF